MKIVKGNNKLEISKKEYIEIIKGYKNVILDIGTGDGRFVYKSALENHQKFYIGLDPSAKQLKIFSKKAVRKKLSNTLFIVGSSNLIPHELENTINNIYIILPWGTLLQNLVLPSREFITKLNKLARSGGKAKIILGYSKEHDPSETERLNLPELSKAYLENNLVMFLKEAGFKKTNILKIEKSELKNLESTWSKKLAHGKIRQIFEITFEKYIHKNQS